MEPRERGPRSRRGLVALALLALGCRAEAERAALPPARAAGEGLVVRRGDFEERFLLTGELDAVSAEELQAPYTRVWNLSIRWMESEGAQVKAGQKLLEFENSEFTGELERGRLAATQAKDDLIIQGAQNDLSLAEREFAVERQRIALEKAELQAAVPPELRPLRDHEEQQLALERARVDYEKAQAELEAAKDAAALELKLKRLALEKIEREIRLQEEAIDSLSLKAPREDILIIGDNPREGRKLQIGDVVWPGLTVVKLPNLSRMRVKATLSDVDEGRITEGMPVTCYLDAYPDQPIPGTIEWISPIAQEPERESLRRSFQVLVALEETDRERMRPGMSVKVEVHAERQSGVLLLPRAAIDFRASPPRVRLANGEERSPSLGPCNAQDCVLTEGLEEGTSLRGVEL